MHTVVETTEFSNFAKKSLSIDERADFIDYISANPLKGDLIQGTGGLRKIRWARSGKGKSGGYRVIYYYYNQNIPIFLITAYAKNKKDNISDKSKKLYKQLAELIVETYGKS